jgi:hypothetical protein
MSYVDVSVSHGSGSDRALAVLSFVDFVKIAVIRLMAARLTGQRTRYRDIRPGNDLTPTAIAQLPNTR